MAILPKISSRAANPDLASAPLLYELATRPAHVEAARWFAKERAYIDAQHLAICRIPAPTFLEQPRAEWFRNQLNEVGWSAKLDRAGNVIATLQRRDPNPIFVVSAHLDTVLTPSRPEDVHFTPDGRLVGPGSADNGSGLAALLTLARLLSTFPDLYALGSSIALVANVGEEGEGNLSGMRFLCRSSLPLASVKAFVVLDGPSVDHITAQALASRRYEIVLSGPGGHSWNDHGTPNPVHALASLIHSYSATAEQVLKNDPDVPSSYNFGTVEGGTSINSIPAYAAAKLDLRSESARSLDVLASSLTTVLEQILEAFNRRALSARLTAKVREIGSRPGGRLRTDSLLLKTIQSVDAHLGIRSKLDCASTDANIPLSLGLPAVSIGTGGHGGGAHTPHEWYSPDGREIGLRRIFLILASLFESYGAFVPSASASVVGE